MLLLTKLDELKRTLRVLGLPLVMLVAGCASQPSHAPNDAAPNKQAQGNQPLKRSLHTHQPVPVLDIWDRVRTGFALQEHLGVNPRIERQRLSLTANPNSIKRATERSEPYLYYVVEQLEKHHVPLEIALLPVIESSYNPLAYSPAHAVGLWQFIPSTGRNFNLRQTSVYDGRRDVMASTQAAIRYLTRLEQMFDGDWLLALAAYNAGEGTVGRAIERNQRLNLPTDYWNLQLPKETQDYVPKLLALSQIVLTPEAFGVSLSPIANEPYFEKVAINRAVDLAQVAEMVDLELDELYKLNAAFKRKVTENAPQHLLVPIDKAQLLTHRLDTLPAAPLVRWQPYRVKRGESLHVIARRYGLEVQTLKQINDLSDNRLRVGQLLNLPAEAVARVHQSQNTLAQTHRVRSGDNLWSIARAHKVSVAQIKALNNLRGNALSVGQTLRIQGPAQAANTTYYKVRQGDSLSVIAQRFKVKVEHLRRWNPRLGQTLKPGQTVAVHIND